ncbi:gliding motility-associated ABC transporter ATP-binding subunit GldA [Marinifilum sp. D714]|uniref:gliding motility-associated ABC transporter ATP-binding subunit GldA n=1 Tax=Marinifilum sp. D714 TaxID=2937523 RepID=UPI0027C4F5C8|nr:gliding motility-associated ABC transporter ATP-binding subunit GldA [Marinifilum sp. D714]MDQ2180697.1 gliding motility-associated ABC transporter ATP-binding subunit GldA [Marinifilum sp. D714]
MSIKVQEVSKLYGKQKALDQVSFEINQGEVVGFLGPNGAGKSTMMKIITGFIPQSSGLVEVNGLNIEAHSLEVRRQIGYLPEHNPLYLEMYVKEYLDHVASIYKLGKAKKSRIAEMIDLTGLGLEQNKKIGALSKGYRQRVGIAQALIHDPKVVILDEPTTGLDPNQLVEIRNLIQEIGKQKTVMLSTHIMQEVEACCERALIINKGNLVADKKIENLSSELSSKKIEVEFAGDISLDILNQHEGIKEAIAIGDNKFSISSSGDIRKEIFQMAVKNNWELLEMKSQTQRLEDLFHELTK